MKDLKKAIRIVESTSSHIEIGDLPYELGIILDAAKAYLAAQEDDEANNEDGLSAEAFRRVEGDPAPQWTPVEDGLPEVMHNVLMTVEGVVYAVSGIRSSDGKWYDDNGDEISGKVIAWMLTPYPYQPPKPVDPLLLAVEALEQIAKGENLYANQQIAREALAEVKGENNDNTC